MWCYRKSRDRKDMKIKGADNQDVVENTPRTLPRDHVTFGHYRCCATSGCAHPREPRRGTSDLLSPPVAMLLLLRKKEGKAGHAQNLLPVRTTSSHVTDVTSGQKANWSIHVSSIYVRTKSHLRWCCDVVLPEIT
jgi:hypothetical protein